MGAAQTVFSAEDIYFLEKHSIMDRAQVEVGRGDVLTLSGLFKDEKCLLRSGTTTSKRSTQVERSAGIRIACYIPRSSLARLGKDNGLLAS